MDEILCTLASLNPKQMLPYRLMVILLVQGCDWINVLQYPQGLGYWFSSTGECSCTCLRP